MYQKYKKFVFFSAGPVGDHLVQIDMAEHFYKSTGIPSLIVMKHPNAFLVDLAIPYKKEIEMFGYKGFFGISKMTWLAIESIWNRNCFVFIFPISLPIYLKLFIYYIRFFTRSRAVGFNLEGTKSFALGKGYASIMGYKNTIKMLPEMFYVSANRMLTFLGFKEVLRLPRLRYVPQEGIFDKIDLKAKEYITMHITPSHILRTFPPDKWNTIIRSLLIKLPYTTFVFTGTRGDELFINEALDGISRDRIRLATGKTNAQELITLYANAKVNITVQTGNGLMINMLHVPTVVVNIKGTAMFYYDFNKNATILFSEKECCCNPFETECNLINYKGKEYMACLFNIPEEDVVAAVVDKASQT